MKNELFDRGKNVEFTGLEYRFIEEFNKQPKVDLKHFIEVLKKNINEKERWNLNWIDVMTVEIYKTKTGSPKNISAENTRKFKKSKKKSIKES